MATHFHALKIKDVRTETPECVSIALEIPGGLEEIFRFIPGQNITVKSIIAGEDIRRSYSICSIPSENELRIAVKKVSNGRFSGYANQHLKRGDILEVLPPTGSFFTPLDPLNKKHYTAFAAGSGITPVLSIIKNTLLTEPLSRFTLIYGNRSRASILFREQLEAVKNQYMERFSVYHILSREKPDTPFNYGRIDAEKCRQLHEKLVQLTRSDAFFLCGPEEMIFIVKQFLQDQGVDEKKIHFELFTAPGQNSRIAGSKPILPATAHAGKTSEVVIKSDGITFRFNLSYDEESILDAALQRGADLPFACKGGVCSTCRARLIEGEVEMDNNYALEKDELEDGYILTCQSHPRTPSIVVDYDVK